jgi:hypothetical protein
LSRGFNTNVRVGNRLFHVQTEDRGAVHAKIDTAVYLEGRVIHRHSSPYARPNGTSDEQVQEQHGGVIEALRAGSIVFDGASAGAALKTPATNLAGGISVTLLNAISWVSSGTADLLVEVRERGDGAAPIAGARVEARLDGITPPQIHEAATDASGRAQIRFPLPSAGVGAATLVIRAIAPAGENEIRFNLRAKAKTPAAKQ